MIILKIIAGLICLSITIACFWAIGRHLGEAIEREIAETYEDHKGSDNDNP